MKYKSNNHSWDVIQNRRLKVKRVYRYLMYVGFIGYVYLLYYFNGLIIVEP